MNTLISNLVFLVTMATMLLASVGLALKIEGFVRGGLFQFMHAQSMRARQTTTSS